MSITYCFQNIIPIIHTNNHLNCEIFCKDTLLHKYLKIKFLIMIRNPFMSNISFFHKNLRFSYTVILIIIDKI